MNEEQLANLISDHLDAVLAGESIPDSLPAEAAELLAIAQTLAESAPTPDPDFGPALKESLPGPSSNGPGGPGSIFSGPTLFILGLALLIMVGGLALVASLIVVTGVRSNLSESVTPPAPSTPSPQPVASPTAAGPAQSPTATASPAPTQNAPVQSSVITPTIPAEPTVSSTPTATPIIDVLPVVTVSVDIGVEPPNLVPGSGGGGSDGSGGGGDGNDDNDDDGGDDDDD